MLTTVRTFVALSNYGVAIVPRARREIRKWASVAASIPDRSLRHHATQAIVVDDGNAEAVAAFAALAPRHQRHVTVELLVAYQILVDYLDMLGEHVCRSDILCGLEIGSVLVTATDNPSSPLQIRSLGDDGGYLLDLVALCRTLFWRLPSAAAVAHDAEVAATRCGQALAYTHAAAQRASVRDLRRWTAAQPRAAGYTWWEIAAGGNSNLAILALIAAAADPATTSDDATAVAAAYWPHVCVMSTLLDSLVDYERDALTDNFSFVSHYPDRAALREGVLRATARSLAASSVLRRRHVHTMIVCGVAGYYAAVATPGSLAAQVAPSLLEALGPSATPIVRALRWRHRAAAIPAADGSAPAAPGTDDPGADPGTIAS